MKGEHQEGQLMSEEDQMQYIGASPPDRNTFS